MRVIEDQQKKFFPVKTHPVQKKSDVLDVFIEKYVYIILVAVFGITFLSFILGTLIKGGI